MSILPEFECPITLAIMTDPVIGDDNQKYDAAPRSILGPGMSPMSLINTPYGGCWAPGSMILMATLERKAIEDVRKGEKVWTLRGIATVEYALELGTEQASQPMVKLGDLWITPWHPVIDNDAWTLPEKLAPVEDRIMPRVYNLILDHGHIVNISGILTVTLGHNINRLGVAHPFFGKKDLILRDIQGQPGFSEGRPVFKNLQVKREDDLICGWYDKI
jgi:hypothetical protein